MLRKVWPLPGKACLPGDSNVRSNLTALLNKEAALIEPVDRHPTINHLLVRIEGHLAVLSILMNRRKSCANRKCFIAPFCLIPIDQAAAGRVRFLPRLCPAAVV